MEAMLAPDVSYRIAHHDDLNEPPQLDVREVSTGVAFEQGDVRVLAAGTDHKPVEPTIGFRVEHDGKAVVLGGDGVPCAGLDELCRGADVYVQTVLREDLVRLVPSARFNDILDYHSSVEQAAQTAAKAGVKVLVLTHQIPSPAPGSDDEWRARRRRPLRRRDRLRPRPHHRDGLTPTELGAADGRIRHLLPPIRLVGLRSGRCGGRWGRGRRG